ncbi:AMP-binding protein [Chachezhania sediminis]|uniref:AMP-binding protein n=1 Tax=Chachezhania sediminis TaxID=2599291 RepID=UPI00131DD2DC|nr:AMP-binding protein [Chachezhania sediminis]
MTIRSLADIEALEAHGFDAVFPVKTPWDLIRDAAGRAPDSLAIRYLTDATDTSRDVTLTYAQFADRIARAAQVFRDLGVEPGKSVAFLGQHTPSAQVVLWGAQGAGHLCPINPMLRPDHIAVLLKAADAAVAVICGPNSEVDYWSALVPALRAEGVTIPILAIDADGEAPGAHGHLEKMLEEAAPLTTPHGDETALAACYHTGGTTGAPKLVLHSRLNQAHVARSCALMHDLRATDVMLNGFPLFHVAGAFVYGLSTLSVGGTLLIPGIQGMRNRAFVGSIWEQVERHGITMIGAVPTSMTTFAGHPIDADISSLRYFLTGGSPLPVELADMVERQTGKGVRNILGMTECAGTVAVEPVHGPRTPLSCGLRIPFSQVAILGETDGDADPSKILPAGETGIIALRGPNVSAGYSDPSRNAGTFLPGGWLVSGDVGMLDAEGRLFITGRKKDIIIRGAHNIDPQMIEDTLLAHPEVENAAAVGMPDAYAGELPVAFVTLRAGGTATGADLIGFLKDRIEDPVALPKRIAVKDSLPLTPVGKIFKPTLRQEAVLWAVASAAETAGLTEVEVEVSDDLKATVTAPEDRLPALKAALATMPLTVTFRAGVPQ